MKNYVFRHRLFVALCVLSTFTSNLHGRPWLEVESSAVGDGSFRYHVKSQWCPYIRDMALVGFSTSFTNWIELSPAPQGWNYTNSSWSVNDQLAWQTQPYEAVFTARSSLTNHCLTNGCLLMSMTILEFQQYASAGILSQNVVGYWMCPVLSPCLPEQADGSPPSVSTNLSYPDVVIRNLIRDTNAVIGVEYEHNGYATLLLEATRDFEKWRKLTYFYTSPGTNTWTTNANLTQWGNFFRLGYVGYGHIPSNDLPSLNQTGPAPVRLVAIPTSAPKFKAVKGEQIEVDVATVPGRKYQVSVFDAQKTFWTTTFSAAGDQKTVSLPTQGLPQAGFIRVKETP